jgi:hypothetical protein
LATLGSEMSKHVLWGLAFSTLALGAWWQSIPIWILFTFITAYHVYRAFRPRALQTVSVRPERNVDESKIVFGVLGNYAPDENDRSDQSFGLYIKLGRHNVFVDIREDESLETRKARALYLANHSKELERSLEEFISNHPIYETRSVSYIGLHSKNLEQGEVFWDPEGYTLLRGLIFELK